MKHNVHPWILEYNNFLLICTAMGGKGYRKNGAYRILQTLLQFGPSQHKHNFLVKSEGISSPSIQINFIIHMLTSTTLKKCYDSGSCECGGNEVCICLLGSALIVQASERQDDKGDVMWSALEERLEVHA